MSEGKRWQGWLRFGKQRLAATQPAQPIRSGGQVDRVTGRAVRLFAFAGRCSVPALLLAAVLFGAMLLRRPAECGTAAGGQAATARAKLQPGDVDVARSRVYVFVDKSGFGHQHAVEGRLRSGHISLGAASKAGKLVFEMASFYADTAAARRYLRLAGQVSASTQRKVTANMLGPRVLDVRHYPTAVFDINSALPIGVRDAQGRTRYRLSGLFTLHGVRRPLTVDAYAKPEGGAVRLRGSFYLRQTDYGIKPFSMAFGALGVANQLAVYGDLVLAGPAQTAATAGVKRR